MESSKGVAVVTGSAGFIGHFVSKQLLNQGWIVVGVDSLTDYYDVELKLAREKILSASPAYIVVRGDIAKEGLLKSIFLEYRPALVVHLAAQAGVRYSIENPRSYFRANLAGTFELLEAARDQAPAHILMASTSSVYGANDVLPFVETARTDHPLSTYAATKKASEDLAHSYSHIYKLPITAFRFFTVYGPWGRPDMALFKFVKATLNDEHIDLYNNGRMRRDFTYVEDLAAAVVSLSEVRPDQSAQGCVSEWDSKSKVAPYRVVNVGSGAPVELDDFVSAIELAIGKKAHRRLMPMQLGDVKETFADNRLLKSLVGEVPHTDVKDGVAKFVKWYREYYVE